MAKRTTVNNGVEVTGEKVVQVNQKIKANLSRLKVAKVVDGNKNVFWLWQYKRNVNTLAITQVRDNVQSYVQIIQQGGDKPFKSLKP